MTDEATTIEPNLLTARQAAAVLNVSEKTLRRLSAPKGTIPVIPIGKRGVRYELATLRKWILDQQVASLTTHNGRG